MTANIVPENSDVTIKFTNITKDGVTFDFNTVESWWFAMGRDPDASPLVVKNSTGVDTSGHFEVDNSEKYVAVSLLRSELSASSGVGDGTYTIALFAETSGVRHTHLRKMLQIQKQIGIE